MPKSKHKITVNNLDKTHTYMCCYLSYVFGEKLAFQMISSQPKQSVYSLLLNTMLQQWTGTGGKSVMRSRLFRCNLARKRGWSWKEKEKSPFSLEQLLASAPLASSLSWALEPPLSSPSSWQPAPPCRSSSWRHSWRRAWWWKEVLAGCYGRECDRNGREVSLSCCWAG